MAHISQEYRDNYRSALHTSELSEIDPESQAFRKAKNAIERVIETKKNYSLHDAKYIATFIKKYVDDPHVCILASLIYAVLRDEHCSFEHGKRFLMFSDGSSAMIVILSALKDMNLRTAQNYQQLLKAINILRRMDHLVFSISSS